MKLKEVKKYLIGIYIILMVGGIFYVNNVLEHTEIDELDKDKEEVDKVHPVKVYLNLDDGTKTETYEVKLSTRESVNDLLENLRDNNKIFFEKTRYIYGDEIEDVNKKDISENYHWKVFFNDTDITYQMNDVRLVDNTTYHLRLVKK